MRTLIIAEGQVHATVALFIKVDENQWFGGRSHDKIELPGIYSAHMWLTDIHLMQIIAAIATNWPGWYTLDDYANFAVISEVMDSELLADILGISVETITDFYGHAVTVCHRERHAYNIPPAEPQPDTETEKDAEITT